MANVDMDSIKTVLDIILAVMLIVSEMRKNAVPGRSSERHRR